MGTPIKSAAPIIEGLTDEEVADAFALRLLDPDGPNVGRRVWAALEQIPVLKARLAALEADARRLDLLEREAMDHPVTLHNTEQGHWGDFRGFAPSQPAKLRPNSPAV